MDKRQHPLKARTLRTARWAASGSNNGSRIFEADFQPCSYGFRPGRRAHDAIAEIQMYATQGMKWVLEARHPGMLR